MGRLTEADTLTIWLGATPSGLTSAHLQFNYSFLILFVGLLGSAGLGFSIRV